MKTHGGWGYTNGCRCDDCRAAWRALHAAWRARQDPALLPPHVHGTKNGYNNYGCRCPACRDAIATYWRALRARRRRAA